MRTHAIAVGGLLEGSILSEQITLETECRDAGVRHYRGKNQEAIDRNEGAGLPAINRLTQHWFQPLVDQIVVEADATRSGEYGESRNTVGPILTNVDPERAAAVTLVTALNLLLACGRPGVSKTRLMAAIGRAVVAEVNADILRATTWRKLLTTPMKRGRKAGRDARRVNWMARKHIGEDTYVAARVKAAVGGVLLDRLLDVAWLPVDGGGTAPAIAEIGQTTVQAQCRVVFTATALNLIELFHREREAIRPRHEPMLHEPNRWVQTEDGQIKGGYTTLRTPYILRSTPLQRAALRTADLRLCNEGRTAVESNPWRVNGNVAGVSDRMIADNSAPNLPSELDHPLPPDLLPENDTPANRKKMRAERSWVYRMNTELAGQRESHRQRMATSRRFRARSRFYLPHAFDFRQRLVPIPPHLNHMGDDFARGLLETGWDNPVTAQEGFDWLLIHAANCYGVDKASYSERIVWAKQNLELIRGCARDPYANDFWVHADKGRKPWQFLAACFALDDPEGAGARLPCQFDGSANVLQHYAAMMRDETIANLVNLIPLDRPADPYNGIATTARGIVYDEAMAGKALASVVGPLVTRDLCKRPFMIRYYDGTRYGLQMYVGQALEEAGVEADFWTVKRVAAYVTSAITAAIAITNEYAAADTAMAWLKDCARLIAKKNRPVEWTTPVGFPVVQPYRRERWTRVNTVSGPVRVRVVDDEDQPVNVKKQVSAVSPNFVHSVDSSHMLMAAMRCHAETIWFAPVHDCFWTHANTASRMNVILRETFVELHEMELLERVRSEWAAKHRDIKFPEAPKQGALDRRLIMDSPYAFA